MTGKRRFRVMRHYDDAEKVWRGTDEDGVTVRYGTVAQL